MVTTPTAGKNKKDSVLNILAHDLAGPLGFIKPLISSLKGRIGNADDVRQLDIIAKITNQAVTLIRDLTNREFLDTVDVVLAKKRINISLKLLEYMEEYQNASEDMNRVFSFNCPQKEIFISVDESKLMQVFNNLITNALKFTHAGGSITLSIEERDDAVRFSVSDNGVGIPEKYHHILFEKFTEARRKGLQGEPTTGLGMSVVKTIIEWHEGKVWFSSKENEGTTVFFELPKKE